MDAILLCMKKKGIRFFWNIKFPTTRVIKYHAKDAFLEKLRLRKNKYDNVLIMAHGYKEGILTTTNNLSQPYIKYITKDDADAFENSFVFAISCSTAEKFGEECIDKGAIAYLGYQIDISHLFSSRPKGHCVIPKRVTNAIDSIVKRIFIQELSRAFEEFLKTPISISVLRERFAFLLEKRIAELPELTLTEIRSEHDVGLTESDVEKFVAGLTLHVLSCLDETIKHLVCIGDENYISSSCISYQKATGAPRDLLIKEFESNKAFLNIRHTEYKKFLRTLLSEN